MQELEGKVEANLSLSEQGVEQYMRVNTQDAGQLLILPGPSFGGIYAQATINPRETVRVLHIGEIQDTNWGILLNNEGKQYGFPMSYDSRDLQRKEQVIYVAKNEFFPRSNYNAKGKPHKRTFDIQLFESIISVHYDNFDPEATIERLNDFQGFVACVPARFGKKISYKLWCDLTIEDVSQVCIDKNYRGIQDLIKPDQFSFVTRADRFDAAALEALLTEKEEKVAALEIFAGKTATFKVPEGAYTPAALVEYLGQLQLKGKKKPAVRHRFKTHIEGNNPIMLNKQEVRKNQSMQFDAGKKYYIRVETILKTQPLRQPVKLQTQPRYEKPKLDTPKAPQKQVAAKPETAQPEYTPPKPAPETAQPKYTPAKPAAVTPSPVTEHKKVEPRPAAAQQRPAPQPRREQPMREQPKRELVGAGVSSRPKRKEKVQSYRSAVGGG